MAAHREVSVRLADGSTETGYFKEREAGDPSSLEIGVQVLVGQRVSFIGSGAEWEVQSASWQKHAKWCHADLVPPRPRRLNGPIAAPAVAPAPQPEPQSEPADAGAGDDNDQEANPVDSNDDSGDADNDEQDPG